MLRCTAREDPLTGVANRRSFDERLDATGDRTENASDLVRRADRAPYHAKPRRRRDGADAAS